MAKKNEASAAGLPGRRSQAARNDETILEAARAVFIEDPRAPVSAVAARAGVGMSALYRRYAGKEELLRRLCHDGLLRFVCEAEAALADPDPWRALTAFLGRVVDADVHSLTVHLAGSFTPTEQMYADSLRAAELGTRLVERARGCGRLRADIVPDDVTLVLEGCAAIRLPDAERTRQLRRRHLALLVRGMDAAAARGGDGGGGRGPSGAGDRGGADTGGGSDGGGPDVLPGPPPTGEELGWRWRT
ncbi:TetR/AcrR family transcriptional regulator [Nocardiopsis sp. NRRL B-16309]|uniref:TetR/AcrR family transcriptional regulator n=1 Tax=Nocardiopsis sp. NRRL B-16309 TaxID=1519494 RepID=UPI0006AEA6C0|nr:TetR/AcrR family transcriptional regulator [Nocardiopsis sp. NRRL B-16309]KOX11289.1 TetR family transcriptional regulator [Nocardiopsis sp. NRRL B-16309]